MKLNYKRTIFVGFAFFLICVFWQAYDAIIPKILTDKFGMSQTLSGVIMALDNVLALFLLPLFGALSDRCKSHRGRRTPYIIIGTVLAAVIFVTLSFADDLQLTKLSPVLPENAGAQETLYDAGLTITTPDGETVDIQEEFTREEYCAISAVTYDSTGAEISNKDFTDYVVPARQLWARQQTRADPLPLILFIVLLLAVLVAMASFRSPAVALMPDVTIKPLRSKANAIINLMGSVGGILVLILGIAFGTGKAANSLMSYTAFFIVISAVMLAALAIFLWKVKEPALSRQMQNDSVRLGLENETEARSGRRLSKEERRSLLLILASVVLWFFGYNAVTSKYSVYAGAVLNLDYNTTLMVATGAAIISYIPVGFISTRFGRRKTIMAGILILTGSFVAAAFMRAGSSALLMNILFALAGIGWATINVNSYPMVVELAKGGDVGKYTGIYYTASMAAQTATPIVSGMFLDMRMTSLFPYAFIFVALSFVTMFFVRHGDSKPVPKKDKLEYLDTDD